MSLLQLASLTEDQAQKYWEDVLWLDGPVCPKCGSFSVTRLKGKSTKPGTCKCRDCLVKFTVTTDTFMHKTHLPLRVWAIAVHMLCSNKKGVSALYLSRELEIGYEASLYMLQRIREGMKPSNEKLSGTVEVDEIYLGGKTRMGIRGRGSERKKPAVVMVERSEKLERKPHTPKNPKVGTGRVIAKPIKSASRSTLTGHMLEHVDRSSDIMTDEWGGYRDVRIFFKSHGVVRHKKKEYATNDGRSSNTAESVNAIIRRSYRGVYHWWSHKHSHRYLWEISFRWSNRHLSDSERRETLMRNAPGRKITYRQLVDSG